MSGFSREAVESVKRSTVAIGLAKSNLEIASIIGTGFLVDVTGIIITAGHVFDGCKTAKQYHLRFEKMETNIAAFRPIHDSKTLDFDRGLLTNIKKIKYSGKNKNAPLLNIDLGYGILSKPFPDIEPLGIEPPTKIEPLNQIGMVGFPAGHHTLDTKGENMGVRYSPTVQLGRIGSLLPFDDAPNPYGIQTDIIGVGGSSGSPLIDPAAGSVLGMAQHVLPGGAEVEGILDMATGKKLKSYGTSTVGQVYGISNHVLFPVTKDVKEFYKTGKIKDIKIDVTGLDFGYQVL